MSYRNWLVRPALFAGIGMTLFGNLDNAQHSWGGYLSHGWAPIAYLITFETLIRSTTTNLRRWISGSLVLSIAAVAMVISFNTLRHAAESWGWDTSSAWLFPVIVDLMVIVLSLELAWSKEEISTPKETLQEIGATQPLEPGIDWEEEFRNLEISSPISPAVPVVSGDPEKETSPRAPRAQWDAEKVVEMILRGEKAGDIVSSTGIGRSTLARYVSVTKELRENRTAPIAPERKVPSAHVALIRELVAR